MKTSLFPADMEAAGRHVEPYKGRYFWVGPAVRASDREDLQEVIRATAVPLQWDNLGLGFIVYPVTADPAWYEAALRSRL